MSRHCRTTPVGGVDHHPVVQGSELLLNGPVEPATQERCKLFPQHVRPGNASYQEGAPAEERSLAPRRRGVRRQVGHVLGGMPRSGQDLELHSAQIYGVALVQRPVVVQQPAGGAGAYGGAGAGGQLPAPRDKVVMYMGLESVGDPHALGRCLIHVHVHVPGGIDDGAYLGILRPHQVGRVPQALYAYLLYKHAGCSLHVPDIATHRPARATRLCPMAGAMATAPSSP